MGAIELTILISVSVLLFTSLVYLLIRLYIYRHRHNLSYHKYNKLLISYENKYKVNLVDKKIRFKTTSRPSIAYIHRNLESLATINKSVSELFKIKNMQRSLNTNEVVELLNNLPSVPNLVDMSEFIDSSEKMLMKDLMLMFVSKTSHYLSDVYLKKIFGPNNHIRLRKKHIFIYNDIMLQTTIESNLLNPSVIHYDHVDPIIEIDAQSKRKTDYVLILNSKSRFLFTLYTRARREQINEYEELLKITHNYEMYKDVSSIKDAFIKYEHLEKVYDSSLKKIETMSGPKFSSYVQSALKSIYNIDIIQKSNSEYGNYLTFIDEQNLGHVVIQVKRHNDPINSTVVKELKAIQSLEGAFEAWLITNTSYTKQAIELAQTTNIKLLGLEELKEIIIKYNNNFYKTF